MNYGENLFELIIKNNTILFNKNFDRIETGEYVLFNWKFLEKQLIDFKEY